MNPDTLLEVAEHVKGDADRLVETLGFIDDQRIRTEQNIATTQAHLADPRLPDGVREAFEHHAAQMRAGLDFDESMAASFEMDHARLRSYQAQLEVGAVEVRYLQLNSYLLQKAGRL